MSDDAVFHNTTKQPIGKNVDSIRVPTGTLALIWHQPVKQCKELSSRNWYFQIESSTNFLKHSNFKLIVFVIRNQCTKINVELVMFRSDVNYRSRDDRTDSLAVEKFSSSTAAHTIVVAFLQ